MSQIYSDPSRASDPYALPDTETFWIGADYRPVPQFAAHFDCPLCGDPSMLVLADQQAAIDEHNAEHVGWYWWSCSPGCLPDGDALGPFDTEQDAIDDAQQDMDN